jgi:ubiquinone/menaquinone biosynthesis C-methylase UbiE
MTAIHQLFEHPRVYGLTQKLNPFSVSLMSKLIVEHVPALSGETILDIGSGVGTRRKLFPNAKYTGIDHNPAYIDHALRIWGGGFQVMDAGRLDFPDASFDHAMSIAVCHHLDDATLSSMVREALRIVKQEGALHIIDAVLPASPRALLKKWVFESDRGRHQRTLAEMAKLLAGLARVTNVDLRCGLLHDVCYFRLASLSRESRAKGTAA